MSSNVKIREELETLRQQNGGVLHEELVVSAAAKPTSPLHEYFTWDNTEAARLYRLEEARGLIRRVYVTFESADHQKINVRAYASLASDRLAGGGYRSLTEIMSDADRREELLQTALAELEAMRNRYQVLTELAPVFAAAQQVKPKGRRRRTVPTAGDHASA